MTHAAAPPVRAPKRAHGLAMLGLVAALLSLPFVTAGAQQIQLGDADAKASHAQRVSFAPDLITLDAGKPEWVELRFHVMPGFHVNAHDPHDELLIPTALKLDAATNLRVLGDAYPPGTPLQLSIGAGETLSTYQGEFRVRVHLLAAKGESVLNGTLHYQACDAASCFPPRDLPVSVPVSAR